MAFMMKKKKYKFQVELLLEELTAVPFVSAVLFAKVRLLDGGNFSETSTREEVLDHAVRWDAKFTFVCKMNAIASTGVLDPCILRVSIRKEIKGGRSFQKLGFTDLNLAEFAGSGVTARMCLLEGYDTRHRQDNSMLKVAIGMSMLSGDILFKVPSPLLKNKTSTSQEECSERHTDFSSGSIAGSIASGSSGFGSLPKKRPALFGSELVSSGSVEVADSNPEGNPGSGLTLGLVTGGSTAHIGNDIEECVEAEPGHSRNSSNTSQLSKASGYSSLNSQSQHSRQSSSGDSGHIRNLSGGSSVSETGSLDRAKAALERRNKKAAEETVGTTVSGGRVEITRVNPGNLIDELIRTTNLHPDESAETSGLQLFIAKDGTTALNTHEVKSQISTGVFKQVVMEEDR